MNSVFKNIIVNKVVVNLIVYQSSATEYNISKDRASLIIHIHMFGIYNSVLQIFISHLIFLWPDWIIQILSKLFFILL